jgi:hypothetical protein
LGVGHPTSETEVGNIISKIKEMQVLVRKGLISIIS